MPRTAKGRTTPLNELEISQAALEQFDTSPKALSMRSLAAALGVAPASIYHYFPTEEAVIRAAVSLVFEEAITDYLGSAPAPLAWPVDPLDLLLRGALCLRHAFLRHYRIAAHIALTPESSARMSGTLAVYGAAFEQLGLTGERAGEALFAYGHFVYGSILISAAALASDERFSLSRSGYSSDRARPSDAPSMRPDTAAALDNVISSSFAGTEAEDRLFMTALRCLIDGFLAPATG